MVMVINGNQNTPSPALQAGEKPPPNKQVTPDGKSDFE